MVTLKNTERNMKLVDLKLRRLSICAYVQKEMIETKEV